MMRSIWMFVVLTVPLCLATGSVSVKNCKASDLNFDWSIPKECRSVDTSSYKGTSDQQSKLVEAINKLKLARTFTLKRLKVAGNGQKGLMRAIMDYRKAASEFFPSINNIEKLQWADGHRSYTQMDDLMAKHMMHSAAIRKIRKKK